MPGEFASQSERNHGNAYLALERPGLRVTRCVLRVVLEAWTGIELKSAGGQPLPEQRGPCFAHLFASTLEAEDSILAARNGCLEGISGRDKVRRNFGAGIISALLGRRNAWIIVADAIARLFKQVVCYSPRIVILLC